MIDSDTELTPLYILQLESDEGKPWVARIHGLSTTYGLDREFIGAVRDWSNASRSRRGRIRGVIHAFPLRVGWVVEVKYVSRRGRINRYYGQVVKDGIELWKQHEVIAWAETQRKRRLA